MEFSLTNATLSISANGVGDDRTHINILIYGTGFSQVEYDAQAVSIFNIDDGTYLQQTDVKEYNDPRSSSHSFYINAAPKQFEVRMPVVTTEGAKYEGLKVTFTYGFGMWPEVPNC